jgi:hypothetical protein
MHEVKEDVTYWWWNSDLAGHVPDHSKAPMDRIGNLVLHPKNRTIV